jgi:hypothetical protein
MGWRDSSDGEKTQPRLVPDGMCSVDPWVELDPVVRGVLESVDL